MTRRIVAIARVYGEPGMVAVLYRGRSSYIYMPWPTW